MMKKLPLTFIFLCFAIGLVFNQQAKAQSAGNDLGITINPIQQTGCNLSAGQTLTITIHNYGNVAQTTIPVNLAVNGASSLNGNIVGNLLPNTSSQYTFTQTLNLSAPGTYMIIASLSPDHNPSNDADTIYITNSSMPPGNVNLNFNTLSNGTNVLRQVTNPNSAITQTAAANHGPNGIAGMIMEGVNSSNWVTPNATTNPWTSNPAHFSGVYFCFTPNPGKQNDTLLLSFDLKQLFKTSHFNTNFRVTVNGQQVGPTYNPPAGGYGGAPAPWNRIEVDFSSFLASGTTFEIGLESSVKEEYDNGNGTANLIDNLEVERISARMGTTGVKENTLKNNVAVYPNPSTGLFKITLPEGETCQLEITDLTGKTLLKQEAKTRHHLLDLRGTTKGIYLLKISRKTDTAVRKLIME